jgi:sec-independent protein translocase protein TatA
MALSVFLGMIGPWQIVLIVALVILLFGGRKIPELMKGLGGGVKEFKKAMREDDDDNSKGDSKKLS